MSGTTNRKRTTRDWLVSIEGLRDVTCMVLHRDIRLVLCNMGGGGITRVRCCGGKQRLWLFVQRWLIGGGWQWCIAIGGS